MKNKVIIYLISLVVLVQLAFAFECYDTIDNDLDGLIDAYDPGCYDLFQEYNETDDNETDTLPICSNFFDDDEDGSLDAEDWGCYTTSGTYNPNDNNEANPACSDGIDNDGDGAIDDEDYGCFTESGIYKPYDNSETNPQCSDKQDNDMDCVADYPYDPGCVSVYDNSESPNPPGSVVVCTEDFAPLIWMCNERVLVDDMVETGRTDGCPVYDKDGRLKGYKLNERHNDYAFTGEKLEFVVLVMDKNGINKLEDVFVTVGQAHGEGNGQGIGNDIEANCVELLQRNQACILNCEEEVAPSCNAKILEEDITEFDEQTMRYYECTFTVEPDMYDEYFITAEVCDLDGLCNTIDEHEFFFLNPTIALTVDRPVQFGLVRPGTDAYSNTIRVGNDADYGSGVLLDMFITGTDFTDSSMSGAQCPTTNQLSLSNFRYYATNGRHSTQNDIAFDDGGRAPTRNRDNEGYVNIHWADSFSTILYDEAEVIQDAHAGPTPGGYYHGNLLTPGSEMSVTFKLSLPEPCNGDFDTGEIFFWGEAV